MLLLVIFYAEIKVLRDAHQFIESRGVAIRDPLRDGPHRFVRGGSGWFHRRALAGSLYRGTEQVGNLRCRILSLRQVERC